MPMYIHRPGSTLHEVYYIEFVNGPRQVYLGGYNTTPSNYRMGAIAIDIQGYGAVRIQDLDGRPDIIDKILLAMEDYI
jgi:hypothetical protein